MYHQAKRTVFQKGAHAGIKTLACEVGRYAALLQRNLIKCNVDIMHNDEFLG